MEFSTKQMGALALIAIFILSTVAIYMGGFSNSHPQQIGESKMLSGYVSANATLSSYEPVLEISGSNEKSIQILRELKSQGLITQQIKAGSTTLLTVSDSSQIQKIASSLEAVNVSVIAQATITTSNLTFVSGSGTLILDGISYKIRSAPIFYGGESFPITFSATTLDGQLYTYSNPEMIPASDFIVSLKPQLTQINSSSLLILVPWNERTLNLSEFNSKLEGNDSINYTRLSYVTFSELVSEQALQQLSLSKPAYITSLQPTSFSIDPQFTDADKIVEDLALFSLSPQFPPSIIRLNSQNQTAMVNLFMDTFNQSQSQPVQTYVLQFTMPESVLYGGVSYNLPSQKVLFDSQFAPQEGYGLTISASPLGRRISRYAILNYGPAQNQTQ